MRAVVYDEYGSPDVLHVRDIDRPTIEPDEVLVRVRAASVNSWDFDLLRGTPFMNRIGALRRPKHPVLGSDIAGEVMEVGASVSRFRAGDEVFADVSQGHWGGFAEYVRASEDELAPKPPELSFEQAAAVPQSGVLAWQGLGRGEAVDAGQSVLINGAGGGSGTFAVQLAAAGGAHVTGVDRADKLDLVRSLGAEAVIDYTNEDFAAGRRYDVIIDCAAGRSLRTVTGALKPGGRYVMIGGTLGPMFQIMLLGPVVSLVGSRHVGALYHRPSGAELEGLSPWLVSGEVVPVIDHQYRLDEVADALRYFGEGRVQGKLVITI